MASASHPGASFWSVPSASLAQGVDHIDSLFRFARGLTIGLKAIFETVASVFRGPAGAFGVNKSDPEALGRFAGGIVGVSAALQVARPVLGVFSGLATFLLGLANIRLLARTFAGSSATMATGMLGFGARFVGTLIPAIGLAMIASIDQAALATIARDWTAAFFSGLWQSIRSISAREVVSRLIDPNVARWLFGDEHPTSDDQKKAGAGRDLLDRIRRGEHPNVPDSGLIRKQSMNDLSSNGTTALIQKASYRLDDSAQKISKTFDSLGAQIQLASLSPSSMASGLASAARSAGWIDTSSALPNVGSGVTGGNRPTARLPSFGQGRSGAAIARDPARLGGGETFDQKAPGIMDRLQKQFGLTKEQAAGIVGNLGHESVGFTTYQEKNPRSGRGGAGWAQWTGPRRRAFEAFAQANGLDPRSDEASWRFLTEGDPEFQKGLAAVRGQNTVEGATRAFEETFERAGVKNYASRYAYARRAMGGGTGGTSGAGSLAGVPVKGAQATGGGAHAAALSSLAQDLASNGVAGGLNRFTAFNDHFHKSRLGSKHNLGLASDFTIKDPRQSAAAAEEIRNKMRAAGLTDDMFRVIDEYKHGSRGNTGGHIHTHFQSQQAATLYQRYVENQRALAANAQKSVDPHIDVARPSDLVGGRESPIDTGGQPKLNLDGIPSSQRSGGGRFNGIPNGMGGGIHAPITIQGAGKNAQEIAQEVQRHISDSMNWRTHDMESSLA
jgi:hypothetical protein